MKKMFFCLGFLIIGFFGFSQTKSSWQEVTSSQKIINKKGEGILNSDQKRLYTLDINEFKKPLELLHSNVSNDNGIVVTIPNNIGKLEDFLVVESSNFVSELQKEFPDIRSYSGVGITDPRASINFSIAPSGIQTMILRGGNFSEFIDPLIEDKSIYTVSTSKSRSKGTLPLNCKTVDVAINESLYKKTTQLKSNNGVFKTLRLALSCTGEYTQYFGGTKANALAGMNATMTRVNGIFNRDLAVKLILIDNESSIIYTNAATDPYSDADIGVGNDTNDGTWNAELQSNLTSVIGNANYDIGHLFGASGGGGGAGCIGCVCVNPTVNNPTAKGSGFTSPSNNIPEGDAFDIDFVVHEMGHQLGANHIFSYDVEGTGVSVEPGSGSTIMGYAGITDFDVQNSSDDYFGYASIKQIQDNLATKSCPVSTILYDQTPTVNAGSNYTIPKGTAFVLKGTATDPNGNTMTYCWEQNDSATYNESESKSIAYGAKISGPNFRSFLPSSNPSRYFPAFDRVLSGQLYNTWESVSTVGRNLNFVFTARDNAASGFAQTNSDAMVVTVDGNKGPFEITSQNATGTSWALSSSQTITWNVNGSNTLSGAGNVTIKLSTDGGVTFPVVLVSNTPNDGSQMIMAPITPAKNCRILIEPTDNIFYAVNSIPFTIGYAVEEICKTYDFPASNSIPESLSYAEKTIAVPASSGEISDVNFNISFTHEYISDVQIEVVSPSGTTVKLFDKSCEGVNSSLDLVYDDLGGELNCGLKTNQIVVPTSILSAFNGENPQGIWKLRFRDVGQGDTGIINNASIEICSSVYTPLDPITSDNLISDFILYPNPNKGNFNIVFTSKGREDIKVSVTDLLGRKIYKNTFKNTGEVNELVQISNISAGTYIVTVTDGEGKGVSKIIVK
jgi:subtilisin-like proprotein convertase family protein